jgi:hypothetical protein
LVTPFAFLTNTVYDPDGRVWGALKESVTPSPEESPPTDGVSALSFKARRLTKRTLLRVVVNPVPERVMLVPAEPEVGVMELREVFLGGNSGGAT